MKRSKNMALAGVLCALAVAGSLISFPVLGSRCAPVQHIVNVLCALLLGPWYGLGVAFGASLLRNLLGLGSVLAFPGRMCGALLCALVYRHCRSVPLTLAAEAVGTGVVGGLCAYPLALLFVHGDGAAVACYAYVMPFLISSGVGAALAGVLVAALRGAGVLDGKESALSRRKN